MLTNVLFNVILSIAMLSVFMFCVLMFSVARLIVVATTAFCNMVCIDFISSAQLKVDSTILKTTSPILLRLKLVIHKGEFTRRF